MGYSLTSLLKVLFVRAIREFPDLDILCVCGLSSIDLRSNYENLDRLILLDIYQKPSRDENNLFDVDEK